MDTRILVNGDERQYPVGHFLEHKVFEDENGQDYLKIVHLMKVMLFTSHKDSYLSPNNFKKVPVVHNCYWRWFQMFPLQKICI